MSTLLLGRTWEHLHAWPQMGGSSQRLTRPGGEEYTWSFTATKTAAAVHTDQSASSFTFSN